jgi:threonine dehydratase
VTETRASQLTAPTFADVLKARRRLRAHLQATPTRHYPALDRLTGAQTWVKHDNLLPTGAFKVRGGLNLISQLSPAEREAGVIAASTGNHGQSLAYACKLFAVSVIICAPREANPVKVAGMQELGAEVVLQGRNYDEAREHAEELARAQGYRYVHSGDEPLLIAGVATHTVELLEEQPEIEVIMVPIGGGSGAAGACLAAKTLKPGVRVIGVQSTQSPAAYEAWRSGRPAQAPNTTFAEGLAAGTSFELPQQMIRDHLDDFLTVGDEQLAEATAVMIEKTRTLVEPAGAAPLAGAIELQRRGDGRLEGRTIALICTGANISPAHLRQVLGGQA